MSPSAPRLAVVAILALLCATTVPAAAQNYSGPASSEFQVPVSALGRPLAMIDPSQFHFSTTLSVGSGFQGGTSALQVMNFGYQFKAPLRMNVSIGNTFGLGAANSGNSFFLEGFNVAWQPSRTMLFEIRYQDVRSPLQLYPNSWGYREPFPR